MPRVRYETRYVCEECVHRQLDPSDYPCRYCQIKQPSRFAKKVAGGNAA